jgi:hypothetical protein
MNNLKKITLTVLGALLISGATAQAEQAGHPKVSKYKGGLTVGSCYIVKDRFSSAGVDSEQRPLWQLELAVGLNVMRIAAPGNVLWSGIVRLEPEKFYHKSTKIVNISPFNSLYTRLRQKSVDRFIPDLSVKDYQNLVDELYASCFLWYLTDKFKVYGLFNFIS